MPSYAAQDRTRVPPPSPQPPARSPPSWSTATLAPEAPGLTDAQRALDAASAAEAGLRAPHVATLDAFGIRPSELDPAATRRMVTALDRLAALVACEDGEATACAEAGPGLVGHQATATVAGDESELWVVEDAAFTLRLSTTTDPATGQTERRLFYQDIDGTFTSGVSSEPIERLPFEPPTPAPTPPPAAEEGLAAFLEGALLGDLSDNTSWSALAGQTALGFVPVAGQLADLRDTAAALRDVARGEDGAWLQLAAAGAGWVPGLDVLKGGARVATRLGAEAVEEGAQRIVREATEEGVDRLPKEAVARVDHAPPTPAGNAHARPLGDETRAALVQALGQGATDALLARYGAEALEHYGPAFFQRFRGVTDETMQHLLTAGRISKGQIRGAHDEAAFLDVLVTQGNGEIVRATELAPGIVHYEYSLYQRGLDGKVVEPRVRQARAPAPKTVVTGLSAAPERWRATFVAALDQAIAARQVPADGGEFSVLIEGIAWKGYLRDGVLDTLFPNP